MKLDFETYPGIGRPPVTLHEHFKLDPLGHDNFPTYADCMKYEARILELLLSNAKLEGQYIDGKSWFTFTTGPVHVLIVAGRQYVNCRVVLSTGQVIEVS